MIRSNMYVHPCNKIMSHLFNFSLIYRNISKHADKDKFNICQNTYLSTVIHHCQNTKEEYANYVIRIFHSNFLLTI